MRRIELVFYNISILKWLQQHGPEIKERDEIGANYLS